MKKNFYFAVIIALAAIVSSCGAPKEAPLSQVIDQSMAIAAQHAKNMAQSLEANDSLLPRTIDSTGKLITSDSRWWCSGFFPGVLWYTYELTNDPQLKDYAEKFTARVEREKFTTNNHDVGFILYCSFGNGLRLTGNESYKEVLATGAKSLATRYDSVVGCTRSWDSNKDKWQFPVIIDNMMNMELLMWAGKNCDSTYSKMAKSHADVTMANHFRPDYSCYHVVSYDTITGVPHTKVTHQGANDESAWARGQAWGLYGYSMMYRETGDARYLEQAKNIANFLMTNPNMPADLVPYWDFNAPNIPNEPRDASSAALMCSALIEMSQVVDSPLKEQYLAFAEKQLRSLSSPEYLAEIGTNGNFIIKHNTGSKPHNSEVDVPLTYADYYYVEALNRMKNVLANQAK